MTEEYVSGDWIQRLSRSEPSRRSRASRNAEKEHRDSIGDCLELVNPDA